GSSIARRSWIAWRVCTRPYRVRGLGRQTVDLPCYPPTDGLPAPVDPGVGRLPHGCDGASRPPEGREDADDRAGGRTRLGAGGSLERARSAIAQLKTLVPADSQFSE